MAAQLLLPATVTDGEDNEDLFAALDEAAEGDGPELPVEQTLAHAPALTLTPRVYQTAALTAWLQNGGRGVVVLPTGAGKTVVALLAIERLAARTLVVVPTIELLGQWRDALLERLGLSEDAVGVVGGGRRVVRDLTVITFDSATLPSRRLDGFGLLVVDEAHHLPAASYRKIVDKVGAPYRLGLSATPERADGRHHDLDHLLGPVVYHRLPAELARDRHIAEYVERRIHVSLTPEEQGRYDLLTAQYRWYLATQKVAPGPQAFQALIRRSGHDPAARAALRAHHQARLIALNAEAKIAETAALLAKHRDDKVIVFSEYNALVDELSRRLLLPSITYRTDPHERRAILAGFREGRYSKLVTGRVLNEGVDVPDANVAIVASGSSATREYIQRLGRILRPKPRQAILYELITRKTSEGGAARRRKKGLRTQDSVRPGERLLSPLG
ncbi:MAG TPA: DEAD/DEAH box helicase [Thermomicrobiales bacterium]|nr:DEAD/DEAH box helicase [Thermomicrobiales bacterium]